MINIEALLRFIKDEFIPFVGNKITPKVYPVEGEELKFVADFILRKSTNTLKAICDLCSKDYGEDAQILGRTVFENSLTLAFICIHDSKEVRECLASLYVQHGYKEQQNKQRDIEELKKKGMCKEWIEDLEKVKSSNNQELFKEKEELLKKKALKGKTYLRETYNIKKQNENKYSWSLMSIKTMCQKVGDPYEPYYYFVYWSISNLVHPSYLGHFSYYKIVHPTDEFGETGRGLHISFDCYWRILYMINKIFELGFEEEINQFETRYKNLIN